ncbi:MAG TPA: DUF4824 family protein, partial [Candidatus Polarisedimenticolia bacterium]|nr:DUF4824 family protein [Candidatus Polarisedimenticolia bacterium]
AIALLVLTNAVVLVGVARNRRGAPEARVTLTERELRIGADWEKENTGLWLALETGGAGWQADGPGWFDRRKLQEIGFDCGIDPSDQKAELFYAKALPKRRIAVLEYDGDAWKKWIAGREEELLHPKPDVPVTAETMEERRKELESERVGHSRLFVIDVGNDASELRRRYPDRAHHILADALVRLNLQRSWDEQTKSLTEAHLEGYVSEILVSSIHVPLAKRPVLDAIRREQEKQAEAKLWASYGMYGVLKAPPRYEVTLAYGRRLEPWIEEIRKIGD